jgi:NhaP-type Na+/H+ or K+/H+ antiporter
VRFFFEAGVGVLVGVLVAWLVLAAIRWAEYVTAETLLT